MERSVVDIEGTLAHFKVTEVPLFTRVVLVDNNEGAGMRFGPKRVIYPATIQHLIGRQQFSHFTNVSAFGTVHAAAACRKDGGVGQDAQLHCELGTIREG